MKKILLTLVLMGLLLLGAYFLLTMAGVQKSANRDQPSEVPKSTSNEISKIEQEQEEEVSAVVEVPIETSTSGNDKLTKVTVGDRDDGVINIRRHTYGVVHSTEELATLEDTITYVLFPKDLSGHSTRESPIYKRYLQVLELIQELHQVDISVSKPKAMIRKMENQFILFGQDLNISRVTVENYNYALSYEVLDFFQKKYPEGTFDQDGPYLITTAKNVLNEDKNFSFLYVNLSKFNNSSVKEVIESYKQRLINKGNSEVNILEGWRLTLLSALTTLNADIHIVQTAMAGEL